ncbi:MAG: lipopolysaccharide transport periplasmic protein LptA [Desulfamplus sp.]|nr:lipopolysaccharide transport periplasmic protein LptA [Desulfamplus sp.]
MLTFFHKNILIAAVALIFLISQFITSISAADIEKSQSNQDKKLHVTSDNMLAEKESSIITFSGNVVAKQGDSVIKADKISVILFTAKEKKTNPSNMKQEIKSLTASGNVKLSSANRTASADQAVYTSTDQKIVLTGGSNFPRVMTGESYITGKTIILFQDSGKVIVEGGKEKRVEALFNSKEDFKQE